MAITKLTNEKSFVGSGQTHFDFDIPFFEISDIQVIREDTNGDITTLTYALTPADATEYSVSPTFGDPENGATIILGGAAVTGSTYVVQRIVPYTQQYDLQEGSTIDPTALNKALDRLVAQNQQQNSTESRSISFPQTDSSSITYDVSSAGDRAGKVLGFDDQGSITELSLATSGTFGASESRGLVIENNTIKAKVDGTTCVFDNGDISVGVIDGTNIDNDSININKMTLGSVGTNQIVGNSVTYSKLQKTGNPLVALGAINQGDVEEIPIANTLTTASQLNDQLASSRAIKDYVDTRDTTNSNAILQIQSQMLTLLNVQQAVKTNQDTAGITNTAYNTIPDLEVNITPSASNSKVLVTVHLNAQSYDSENDPQSYDMMTYIRLVQDIGGTETDIGKGTGTGEHCTLAVGDPNSDRMTDTYSISFLDTPSTTNQVTYKVKARRQTSSTNFYVNRGHTANASTISTITVQEIYQ